MNKKAVKMVIPAAGMAIFAGGFGLRNIYCCFNG